MKTYTFNVSQSGLPFKAVLAWSDERGSRWSETQLVNDLDLTVIAPDGTLYLGNDFASGRSTTGGTKDALNPVEVVLIDTAPAGVWTVRVRDGLHAGSKVQPFSIAVSGVGVNDLRPDPLVVPGSLDIDPDIPQVGEPATVRASVQNFGNIEAEDVNVSMFEEGDLIGSTVVDLTPGAMRTIEWSWMPQVAAPRNITVHVDPMGSIDEISELNNVLVQTVEVTTPGSESTPCIRTSRSLIHCRPLRRGRSNSPTPPCRRRMRRSRRLRFARHVQGRTYPGTSH